MFVKFLNLHPVKLDVTRSCLTDNLHSDSEGRISPPSPQGMLLCTGRGEVNKEFCDPEKIGILDYSITMGESITRKGLIRNSSVIDDAE